MARKPMDVQSVLVDASRYSLEEARAKVKKMGHKVTKVDKPKKGETQRFYRFRQREPGQFEKFRYHKLKRKKKDGALEETGVQLALAKSVHLLVKAVGGARPHKYVKRIARPGGGFRYVYAEPQKERHEVTQAIARESERKIPNVALRHNFMVADSALSKIPRDVPKAIDAVKKIREIVGSRQDVPGIGEWNKVVTKLEARIASAKKERETQAEKIQEAAAKKGVKGQPHSVWASAVAAQLGREIGLPEGSLWVPPTARRIEKLVTSGKMTRDEALVETRFSLGLKAKKQETKKSFTEDESMNEELSLSEQEGARIAMEVREDEDARIDKLVKAAEGPELLKKAVGHKYLRRVMTAGGYRYIYQEHPSVKQAAHKGSPAARRLASLIRRSHGAVGKRISGKAHDAVVAAKFHGKRRTKEHLDKIEQVHAEHKKRIGAAIEDARGKGKITHAEAMKLRNYHDKHGGSLGNAIEHLKGLTRDPKSALAQKSFPTKKSAEQLAVEAATPHSPALLVKAVLEVPIHGKTKKKTIPDERLLAVFKAFVRTEYRNASRYNEGTNAQSIYDRVLSGAEYNHYVEAALGVLEKRKTPFSIDFVKECIKEIEETKTEGEGIAPTNTTPGSEVASGG